MKAILTLVGALFANLVVLWCLAHHYEFHTGAEGQIMWRCNNFTGKLDYVRMGDNGWTAVSYSHPKTSPLKPLTLEEADKLVSNTNTDNFRNAK